MGLDHVIVEGYCSWDFKRKEDWTGSKKHKPIPGCKKHVSPACLGDAVKCPLFYYGEVQKWERDAMIRGWLKGSKRRGQNA